MTLKLSTRLRDSSAAVADAWPFVCSARTGQTAMTIVTRRNKARCRMGVRAVLDTVTRRMDRSPPLCELCDLFRSRPESIERRHLADGIDHQHGAGEPRVFELDPELPPDGVLQRQRHRRVQCHSRVAIRVRAREHLLDGTEV